MKRAIDLVRKDHVILPHKIECAAINETTSALVATGQHKAAATIAALQEACLYALCDIHNMISSGELNPLDFPGLLDTMKELKSITGEKS